MNGNVINLDYLQAQGLISFEEITDYSLLRGKTRKAKRTLERDEPDQSPKLKKANKKRKLNDDDAATAMADTPFEPVLIEKPKKKKKNSKKQKDQGNSTSAMSMNKNEGESLIDEDELYQKMSAWTDLCVPKSILMALNDKGFYQPTQIQRLVVPSAIKQRMNVIGAAQTGSGKTLAFGLPILTRLNDAEKVNENVESQVPQALILTPTRELAVQIKQHLQVCAKYQKTKIVVVVGGISQKKQERLLNKKPEIIVATPGRLMQMIDEGNEYLNKIDQIKYLVIDEADRMIEKQHYNELEKLLRMINSNEKLKSKRQNFLFSATLAVNLNTKNGDTEIQAKDQESIDLLINKIQMTKEPKLVDLTTKQITAETLYQTKIMCSLDEKDIYLYYFTSKYVGRTLIFANSIDCVRRLTNIFQLLRKSQPPLHLHANMNQKQRLKNLEKFNAEENSILIASDVASRGLDIPGVMHVIHYQCPRSLEIYIHRSGRTARSMHDGLSVLLVAPDEMNLYKKIIQTFKKESDMKDYPIDVDYFMECKKRVVLARKLNTIEHTLSKEKSNSNWYEKNARLLDIDLDENLKSETHIDKQQLSAKKNQIKGLTKQLDSLLKQTIYPKFFSRNYLNMSSIKSYNQINDSSETAITSLKNKTNKQKTDPIKEPKK